MRGARPTTSRRTCLLVASALALSACGSSSTPLTSPPATGTPATSTTTGSTHSAPGSAAAAPAFVVTAGKVQGPARITAKVGDLVVFTVTSDRDDEVHVHGYDTTTPVSPEAGATVRLRADIPGVFEVELERTHLPLTQLRVSP